MSVGLLHAVQLFDSITGLTEATSGGTAATLLLTCHADAAESGNDCKIGEGVRARFLFRLLCRYMHACMRACSVCVYVETGRKSG